MATATDMLKQLVEIRKSGEGLRNEDGIYISIENPTKIEKNLLKIMRATLCNIQEKTYTYMVPFWTLDVAEEVLNENEGNNMG